MVGQVSCYICHGIGHTSPKCTVRGDGRTDKHHGCYICGAQDHQKDFHGYFDSDGPRCPSCNKFGHNAKYCEKKKKWQNAKKNRGKRHGPSRLNQVENADEGEQKDAEERDPNLPRGDVVDQEANEVDHNIAEHDNAVHGIGIATGTLYLNEPEVDAARTISAKELEDALDPLPNAGNWHENVREFLRQSSPPDQQHAEITAAIPTKVRSYSELKAAHLAQAVSSDASRQANETAHRFLTNIVNKELNKTTPSTPWENGAAWAAAGRQYFSNVTANPLPHLLDDPDFLQERSVDMVNELLGEEPVNKKLVRPYAPFKFPSIFDSRAPIIPLSGMGAAIRKNGTPATLAGLADVPPNKRI